MTDTDERIRKLQHQAGLASLKASRAQEEAGAAWRTAEHCAREAEDATVEASIAWDELVRAGGESRAPFELNRLGGWVVPAGTILCADTVVPADSVLGDGCRLGASSSLGDYCTLGILCSLGQYCSLGDGCTRGEA